jgi:hypothetical protein
MFQQLRSTAYRKHSKVLPPYPKRSTLRTFEIPKSFRLNSSNEPFLIHDSANPDRLIVFASKTSLNYLGKYLNCRVNELQKKKLFDSLIEMKERKKKELLFVSNYFIVRKCFPITSIFSNT